MKYHTKYSTVLGFYLLLVAKSCTSWNWGEFLGENLEGKTWAARKSAGFLRLFRLDAPASVIPCHPHRTINGRNADQLLLELDKPSSKSTEAVASCGKSPWFKANMLENHL
jgi:hypothetical protein